MEMGTRIHMLLKCQIITRKLQYISKITKKHLVTNYIPVNFSEKVSAVIVIIKENNFIKIILKYKKIILQI